MARAVLARLAKAQTIRGDDDAVPPPLRIAQRISCTLQRENARAVLRRLTPIGHAATVAGWGQVTADGDL